MKRISACMLAAMLMAGCNDDDLPGAEQRNWWFEWQPQVGHEPAPECAAFSSELRVRDRMGQDEATFIQGESAFFDFRITNHGDEEHVLTTPAGPQVIFHVVDAQDRVVAGSHVNVAWIQVPAHYVHGAGETAVYFWEWDTRGRAGVPVPVGDYTVYVDERTQCREALSRTAVIRIR
jgi:hypothetical protein